MYDKQQRPSQIIADQRDVIAQQDGIIETLKAALAASDLDCGVAYEPWMADLSPQERALVGALYGQHPKPVSKYRLLELLPGHDHVEDRQVQIVGVKVCHIRRKLGHDVIENVSGMGYRLSQAFYAGIARLAPQVPSLRLAA